MANALPTIKLNYQLEGSGSRFKAEYTPDPIRDRWFKKLITEECDLSASIRQALEIGIPESHSLIGDSGKDIAGKGRLEIVCSGSEDTRYAIQPTGLASDLKTAMENGVDPNTTLKYLLQLGIILPDWRKITDAALRTKLITNLLKKAVGQPA